LINFFLKKGKKKEKEIKKEKEKEKHTFLSNSFFF